MTPSGSRWSADDNVRRGADYDHRWKQMAAAGLSVHGEADFICGLEPSSVLDAGCGTGRVAIELAARGIDVAGVDLDRPMLAQAKAKAPQLSWVEGNLVQVDLGRQFDVVAMPGNVMIFVQPGTEAAVVANMARHVVAGGALVAGFELGRSYDIDRYDADCLAAGLSSEARFATWDAAPFLHGSNYAVSIHRR
jgi:2-polyprenyl-3-methyl-5-hydroxy-6-metoxy-1,4-benzoquinol methylase